MQVAIPPPQTDKRQTMAKFPENFLLLHQGEESVRAHAIETIEKSEILSLHLAATERAADLIHYFVHRDDPVDDDDLMIRLLGIRMFNCLNATLKLLLSGYYQASTLQHRDLIETFFLLDYFSRDRKQIARWRMADDKTLANEFRPVNIRKALDEQDGFTEKKRAAAYKLFSDLAGHPHPRGFQMLKLPDGNHHCGPFFEETPLVASVSELGRSAIQAGGTFGLFFDPKTKKDYQVKLAFLEIHHAWVARFYEKEVLDPAKMDEMRAMIARLPD